MDTNKSFASESDMLDVFIELMNRNGKTTSLEVKEELRRRGFFAIQYAVSKFLQSLITDRNKVPFEFKTDFDLKGEYLVYMKVFEAKPLDFEYLNSLFVLKNRI